VFDEGALSGLQSAFQEGHADKLASTYSQLAVNSICNRYQDASGDLESIAEPQSHHII
jgi:hypothetical protein